MIETWAMLLETLCGMVMKIVVHEVAIDVTLIFPELVEIEMLETT